MPRIALRSGPVPLTVDLGVNLDLATAELFELCQRNPEVRVERTSAGDLVVRPPAGGKTSHRNARIVRLLDTWAEQDSTGLVFDSSGGFLPLCPDFVIELRSPSDSLTELQAKMEEYRSHGARLGWLSGPETQRVHVYRPDRPAEVIDKPERLSAEPELSGFSLALKAIWRPF